MDAVGTVFISLLVLLVIALMVYGFYSRSKDFSSHDASLMIPDAKHFYGLPVIQGAKCKVYYSTESIQVVTSGQQFNIALDKILSISVTTDRNIEKQYVSSVGGAVGGAVLFGPLGAMIGGRAKEKSISSVTNLLVFTYKSDGGTKYIALDVTNETIPAKRFEYKFNKGHDKSPEQIDL